MPFQQNMPIFSFIQKGMELVPIEVEINLIPGINHLQIMGLPDTALKESALRIKSALKTQGYKWPIGKQILVNLRPAHWKKSSRGIELAIACAYLWKTGQEPLPSPFLSLKETKIFVYGELSLDGKVYTPEDLDTLFEHSTQFPIVTGLRNSSREHFPWSLCMLNDLRSLKKPQYFKAQPKDSSNYYQKPDLPQIKFPPMASRLLKIIALGEHATLLVGPAGSGKTTLARTTHSLLGPPPTSLWPVINRMKHWFNESETHSRPFISPHHSTPSLSMIGGGFPVRPGEITRAHGGLLLLDEFLEFNPHVQESLREPLEKGEILISRRGEHQLFPARFLLLATSNLCFCGKLVPEQKHPCRYSLIKCRSYLERLSGPMLDRFDILAFSNNWYQKNNCWQEGLNPNETHKKTQQESLVDIAHHIEQAREFQLNSRDKRFLFDNTSIEVNGRIKGETIACTLPPFVRNHILPQMGTSQRRFQSLMRVARTLADLDLSQTIELPHIKEASHWTWKNFEALNQIFA